MIPSISLRCPSCSARIKAPVQLVGQRRACPNCSCQFVVRPQVPEAEGPMLVGDDSSNSWQYAAPRR
jgi:hypothetical protein